MNNKNSDYIRTNLSHATPPSRFKTFIKKHKLPLILIAVAFMIALCVIPMPNGIHKRTRHEMTEYLKKKYEKEFEIKELEIRYHSPFGYYTYKAKAYPKENPKLLFSVYTSTLDKMEYRDRYLPSLWSYQAEQDVKKKIIEIYRYDGCLRYEFRYDNINFKDLDYLEVIKKCNGRVSIYISYYVFTDNKIDKQKEAEKICKVLKTSIMDHGIKGYTFVVVYLSDNFRKEFEKNGYGKNFDDLYKENKLINFLRLKRSILKKEEVDQTNVNDIIKSFKY